MLPTSTPSSVPQQTIPELATLCRSGMHANLGSSRLGGPEQLALGLWLSLVLFFLTCNLWLGTFFPMIVPGNSLNSSDDVLFSFKRLTLKISVLSISAISGAFGHF